MTREILGNCIHGHNRAWAKRCRQCFPPRDKRCQWGMTGREACLSPGQVVNVRVPGVYGALRLCIGHNEIAAQLRAYEAGKPYPEPKYRQEERDRVLRQQIFGIGPKNLKWHPAEGWLEQGEMFK